jgi:hypothetical protein
MEANGDGVFSKGDGQVTEARALVARNAAAPELECDDAEDVTTTGSHAPHRRLRSAGALRRRW